MTVCLKILALIAFLVPSLSWAGDRSPPPWHLVDIWYRLDSPVTFQSLSIDVEIQGEVEREVPLYIAPFGLGEFSGISFYGGIQNFDNIIVPATGEVLDITRIGLFSRWDERDLRYTRIEPDGWNESSGHEGDFIGVRAPYPWRSGKYRFRINVAKTPKGQSSTRTWVEMSIQSLPDGPIKRIGALCLPSSPLVLDRSFCSFIEIFGDEIPADQYPRLTVLFSNFLLNGEPWKTETVTAVYPRDVPQIAEVSGSEFKIAVRLGDEQEGRQDAEVHLKK